MEDNTYTNNRKTNSNNNSNNNDNYVNYINKALQFHIIQTTTVVSSEEL